MGAIWRIWASFRAFGRLLENTGAFRLVGKVSKCFDEFRSVLESYERSRMERIIERFWTFKSILKRLGELEGDSDSLSLRVWYCPFTIAIFGDTAIHDFLRKSGFLSFSTFRHFSLIHHRRHRFSFLKYGIYFRCSVQPCLWCTYSAIVKNKKQETKTYKNRNK